ncbi:MAG: peptidylprolyl isomerase [Desulfurella sp.]
MLSFFRKHRKYFFVVLVLATLSFVAGGAYLYVSGPFKTGQDVAIKVGSTKISTQEYLNTYNQLYSFYSNLLAQMKGGNVTEQDIKNLHLKQKTADLLIDKVLLLKEAKREGIDVTKADIEKSIEKNPVFAENGKFSKDKYLLVLRENHLKPAEFETSIKNDLYIEKLKDSMAKKINITDEMAKKYFIDNFSNINLSYIDFNTNAYEKKVSYDDKDLKEYYNKNKQEFMEPAMVNIKYAIIDATYLAPKEKPTEQEVKSFYDTHQQNFQMPELYELAHILIKPNGNSKQDLEQAKNQAEEIYKQLTPQNFEQLAKKYSDDKYSKPKGGVLGWLYQSQFKQDSSFAKVAFSLKKGEISKPFETQMGYEIVYLMNTKPAQTVSFAEAKPYITQILQVQKAQDNLFRESKKIALMIKNPQDFDKVCKQEGLNVQQTGLVAINSNALPQNILQKAYESTTNTLLGPEEIKINNTSAYLIYETVQKKEPYLPDFEKAKNKVAIAYAKYKAAQLAKENFNKAIAQKPYDLQKIATEYGLSIKNTGSFSKMNPDSNFACFNKPENIDFIFRQNKGFSGFCSANGDNYIYKITDKNADMNTYEQYKNQLKAQLKDEEVNKTLDSLLKTLKANTKIVINPQIVNESSNQ